MNNHNVIIIDDDPASILSIEAVCLECGYKTKNFESPTLAIDFIKKQLPGEISLIVSDFQMPELNGLELMQQLQTVGIEIPLILVTAFDSTQTAIDAMEMGAFDYITKPINFKELAIIMNRAIKHSEIKERFHKLKKKIGELEPSHIQFIGKSKSIEDINTVIKRVSTTDASVLISGETGTGKEIIAKLIHHHSKRSEQPFVAINCAAIPENLLESELFGHVKGSFTGADQDKKGLFLEANNGTIFLDEIGDMPKNLQTKILRVLQEGKVRRLGENKEHSLNIRVLSATHRNLVQMISNEDFREDLFFRLNVINIKLPSLKQRKEDIPLLADFFIKKYRKIHKGIAKSLSNEALSKLIEHPWPGNVRELENTIERACIMASSTQIQAQELHLSHFNEQEISMKNFFKDLPSLEDLEKKYIEYVLEHTGGAKEKAADILNINRKTLYRKIKAFQETIQ